MDVNKIIVRMERAQTLRRLNQDRVVIQPGFAIQLRIIELAAGTKNMRRRVDGGKVAMFSLAGKLKHVDGKLPGENREHHRQREDAARNRPSHRCPSRTESYTRRVRAAAVATLSHAT